MENYKKIFTVLFCAFLFFVGSGCGGNPPKISAAKNATKNVIDKSQQTAALKSQQAKTIKTTKVKQTITGKVIRVADGDTLTVLGEGNIQYKIRLNAIDAPEKAQPYGTRSKQALADMTMSKNVRVKILNKDKYGRFIGMISTDEVPDVNGAMLEQGLAWHYAYFDKTEKYAELEQEARAAKRGLWRDANPTAPWDYRRNKKKANTRK